MSACVYALFAGVGHEDEHKELFGNTERPYSGRSVRNMCPASHLLKRKCQMSCLVSMIMNNRGIALFLLTIIVTQKIGIVTPLVCVYVYV